MSGDACFPSLFSHSSHTNMCSVIILRYEFTCGSWGRGAAVGRLYLRLFRGINACSAGQRHCRVAAYQVEWPEKFSPELLGGRTWGYGMCRGARCGHVTMWARGRVMLRLSLRLLSYIRRKNSCAPLRRSLSTLSFTKPAALANLLRTTADAFSAARVHKLRSYPDSHRSMSGCCVAECVSRESCLNASQFCVVAGHPQAAFFS